MYTRLKSSLLNHFQKSPNSLSKENKKRLRHSLAECQLSGGADSAPFLDHAPFIDDNSSCLQHHQKSQNTDTTSFSSFSVNSELNFSSTSTTSSSFANKSNTSNCTRFDSTDQLNDPAMPHFALSWSVKYLGSFPISNVSSDYIGQRMERFQPTNSQNVELSVSLLGVRIACEEMILMSHSLRRICSVVGRPPAKQVAYIALEPAGKTYRRLCHVFNAENNQIDEIETVLGQAFDAQILTRHSSLQSTSKQATSTTVNLASVPMIGSMNEKRSASTVFLNKFLGKKGSQTVDDPSCKRKRRPVSAVFSSAINRFSNSTSSTNPKRMTTTDLGSLRTHEEPVMTPARIPSPLQEEPTLSALGHRPGSRGATSSGSGSSNSDIENQSTNTAKRSSSTSTSDEGSRRPLKLVYDEKLGEWIYPLDEQTKSQLDNCNYFVGMPSRECLARHLLSQPEGAFVIRYSESKRKCLALSMRVPLSHNPSGISHYLVIRNEHGFRLKLTGSNKPFPSLQMLLTHHSVIQGQLPATLYFIQWDKMDWKQQIGTTERQRHNRHSMALSKIDENRNLQSCASAISNSGRSKLAAEGSDFLTPKRRSRIFHENMMRRSQFFEIDQIQ